MRTLLTTLFALLLTVQANAQNYWTWTPKGEHHKSACIVTSEGRRGSGVYLRIAEDTVGVLTCAHVFNSSEATVTFSDGKEKTGKATHDKYGFDVGWVFVENKNIKPLTLSQRKPRAGERIEFVTYGGPRGELRHFHATAIGRIEDQTTWYNAYVVSGDSGGVLLNQKHRVVGIQSVGESRADYFTDDNGHRWSIFRNAGSAPHKAITAFCRRVRGCNRPQQPIGGADGVYPPDDPPPSVPPFEVPPLESPPFEQPEIKVEVDYDQLASLVIEKMRENPEPFRGPPGTKGENGIDGQPGQDATVDYGKLTEMVLARMKENPDPFRGDSGKDATVDYDALASEVVARLPPITVIRQAGESGESKTEQIPVGGTLKLPPVRMEIQHPNGDTYFQEKLLGGIIAIKLVPKEEPQ